MARQDDDELELGAPAWQTIRHPVKTAKSAIRREAEAAIRPWVILCVGLSLLALSRSSRR